MPWIVSKQFRFEAAHRLPYHDGACKRLHGHSYTMTVYVQGDALQTSGPETGMVMDFGHIKTAVKPLLEISLDHYYLNETTGLESPTAEALAQWIYDQLKPFIDGLIAIEIGETCTSRAIYSPRPIDLLSLASINPTAG